MCGLTDNSKCVSFGTDSVVKFKNGPEMFYFWGDKVEIEYALVSSDQSDAGENETRLYVHPFSFNVSTDFLELVTDDNTEDFPDSFVEGWTWWDSLEDNDDCIGPCFLEYLGR